MTTTHWPPPPDLASLQELVTAADVEGFIAEGGQPDEYETEAEKLHAVIQHWSTAELTTEKLLPVLESIWLQAFTLDERQVSSRRVKLRQLASQISRFFGPGATPQVRGTV